MFDHWIIDISEVKDDDPSSLIPGPASSLPPEISEEWRKKRDQALILIQDVENRRQDIETSLHLIDLMQTDIQSSSLSQRDQIISLSDQLKLQHPDPESEGQIEQHKQTLLQQLEDKSKEKLDRSAQQRKQLEIDLDCLDSIVSFSRSLLKNATDHQLNSHLPPITDQLNRIHENEIFFKPLSIEITHLEMVDEARESNIIVLNLSDRLNGIQLVEKRSEESERSLRVHQIKGMSGWPRIIFGSRGSGEGQFNGPSNVAVDRDNNIIVCDSENRRIQMFDEEGRFLRSESFEGLKKGEYEHIIAAAVDLKGNIVMFDWNSHQIIIFDPISRQNIRRFGGKGSEDGQFFHPQSICVDHLNRIIVCDTYNYRIQIFDHQGNHLLSFGSRGSEDGFFYNPCGVTVNHLNKIIVCDELNHRIQMFDEKGNHLLSFGSRGSENGQFDRPQRVAVDHHNNILVSDSANHRIQVFDPQGEWISSFGSQGEGKSQLNIPQGIIVDHLNRIIVCDLYNHRVQIF